MSSLSQTISTIAKQEFGFSLVGIMLAEPTLTFNHYADWVEHEYYGSMEWIHSDGRKEKRMDVRTIMPSAKSVITLAYSYYTEDLPEGVLNDSSRGIFARYAWGRDYHKIIKKKLIGIIKRIEEEMGYSIEAKAYVDTGPILERTLAQRAGLGFIGKNSMLINSALGSYLFLSEIVIDQECEPIYAGRMRTTPDGVTSSGGCRTCTKCIDMCPTKAIIQPYVIDARKCISYLTIENKSSIPEEIRPLMKNRIYGCDICQEVCPWNSTKKSKSHQSDFLEADLERQAPKLIDLAQLTEEDFFERFKGTPIMRSKRRGLLRNVAVALGNWGSREAVPSLELLASDDDELIRDHAKWALRQC